MAARMHALVLWLALGGGAARADDGLRCGSYVVSVGMGANEVLAKCGPPSRAERRNHRSRWRRATIDLWTYDRGPREFIRILTLENGILKNVEVGGYGSR